MNCWRLMARIAGTESTANSTSVASTRTSTTSSGVAMTRAVVTALLAGIAPVDGRSSRTMKRLSR